MQALRRGAVARHGFLRMRAAAIAIQAAVRCHQAKASLQRQRGAAVMLQKCWRQWQAVQLLRRIKVRAAQRLLSHCILDSCAH